MKKLLGIVFAVFLLVGCGGPSPEEVAKDYTEYIFKGDASKAIELIDLDGIESQGVTKNQALEKLSYTVSLAKTQADQKGGLKSVKITEVSYNNEKTLANAKIEVTFKDGSTSGDSINLIKVNGKWKIRS